MESYQQPPHYLRPPPPPPPQPPSMAADPHLPHHLHHHPPPPPPANSWFSGQFQYHPPHSPSPPPPPPPPQQQNQWAATPPPPYPAHPNGPYPAQHYPPPPPPPRPHQNPYPPQLNQDWGTANWSHQPGWEYPSHSNEEDWAAKARAWASARSAMENQQPQSQFTPMARQEEPSQYLNQYSQPVETHYQDVQQTSFPPSGFQNFQAPVAPLNRPPMVHQQEPASISSYAPDGNFSFTAKHGALGAGGDMGSPFSHSQGPSSSSVHQQEVPSSYSSIPGKEDYSEGRQHGHSLLSADGRAVHIEQTQFAYGNHLRDPMDQPLEFAPRFSHENDSKMKSGYPDSSGPLRGADAAGAVSSLHAWTAPVAPVVSYPPMTPAFPSAPQHDPSIGVPPVPGQPAPMFGRGPSFQSAAQSITAPVGLGTGMTLHPTAAFPVDAYGASLGSERPKKAAVPNWLREEIIKTKATITNSVPEHFKEGTQSMEDEYTDKSTGKGDQADSKSMDSSRSNEEEDDEDEDYEEAQRIAAINQEIKRVLTEVLSKVTDELFDEIATKVLTEDDPTADVMATVDNHVSNHKASPPPPPVPAPKATAKVLVPVKSKESEAENASGESSSGSPGNVLGLANYSSDDDDEEKQTASSLKLNDVVGENGHPKLVAEEHSRNPVYGQGDHVGPASKLNNNHMMDDKNLDNGGAHHAYSRSSITLDKKGDSVPDDGKSLVKSDAAKSTDNSGKTISRANLTAERVELRKSSEEDSQDRDVRRRDKHESRSSSGRDVTKETENSKEREIEKTESHNRRGERHQKKDKEDEYNVSKEKLKEHGGKHREKTRESDSRKRSPHRDVKESKKERDRGRKTDGKDDADRKRERTKDEKADKSRHKSSSDKGRHKRRRSLSVDSRGKQRKGSPVASDDSIDEASEDSRRKVHSKRRDLSPSPVRSRRRQVSRSPHSRHSQRRHSPYSSLDGSRGRRSRSRSPTRRHR